LISSYIRIFNGKFHFYNGTSTDVFFTSVLAKKYLSTGKLFLNARQLKYYVTCVRYPKSPKYTIFTILITNIIVTHRNAR